jgi:hypothetical protein
MATYVFSLGLIPVKEWISQSRRSRDLRAGSVLLCHWTAKALARLPGERTEIVIPRELNPGYFARFAAMTFDEALRTEYGIPNRASGYFETTADGTLAEEEDEVRKTFGSLQADVLEAEWQRLKHLYLSYRGTFRGLDTDQDGEIWRSFDGEAADCRAAPPADDCPLTLVWVALPAPHPRAELRANLDAVDRLFGHVKRSRPYRAWRDGAPIGKCLQCGRREAVGPHSGYDAWGAWHDRLAALPSIVRGYRLDPGERLCHVCWTRRMAGYAASDGKFRSTGEVAAALWRQEIERYPRTLLPALARLDTETDLERSDAGAVLYASARLLRERHPDDASRILSLRSQLRDRIREHNRAPAPALPGPAGRPPIALEPPAYLALLAYDGDDMGRRVKAHPATVPDAMNAFAHAAAARLAAASAEVFYLAGDEGLAMAPAATALTLASSLRRAFETAFAAADSTATLSVGIALFEHSRPMAAAIEAARAVLEQAKALSGKSGLGVTVTTASGSRWSFVEHWGDPWYRVQRAADLIARRRLASGWAYDAARFVASLPTDAWNEANLPPAAEDEVRRLFFRRLTAVEGRTADDRRAWKSRQWAALPGPGWWRADDKHPPLPCAEQFHLIGFLARQAMAAPGAAAEDS